MTADSRPMWLQRRDLFDHNRWNHEPLPCGCTPAFLPEADFGKELPHEKSRELLMAYGTLFSGCFLETCPTHILEVGVKHGGSLALWSHLFGSLKNLSECHKNFDVQIVGIDKEPKLTESVKTHLKEHTTGVSVQTLEAPSQLDRLVMPERPVMFDLVIDDASHAFAETAGTLEALWPKLRPCGLYVIEDWRTDASRPAALLEMLATKMIGYWPDPRGWNGAPAEIHVWRDLIAVQKGPHTGPD